MSLSRRLLSAIAASVLALASCTTTDDPLDQPDAQGSATDTTQLTTTSQTIAPTTTPPRPESSAPPDTSEVALETERHCGSRIGMGYPDNDEVPRIEIGPLTLLGTDLEWTAANSYYVEPLDDGRYEGVKFIVVIDAESSGRVALAIDERDRSFARLVYRHDARGPFEFADGDVVVYFHPCDGGSPQYSGGFVITAPGCVRIKVIDEGRDEDRESVASIPFGVPRTECDNRPG